MRHHHDGPIGQPREPRSPVAIGAFAAGALAVGAYAVGALAIGRLAIRKATIKELEIGRLSVREIRENTTIAEVAQEYLSLCRRGQFDEAMARFFSMDHVRIESPDMTGPPTELHGVDAIRESGSGFMEDYEIHGFDIEGPFVGGRKFAARFSIDSTFRPTGRRSTLHKLDLYTVHDGKIVRSEIYYNTPPLSTR